MSRLLTIGANQQTSLYNGLVLGMEMDDPSGITAYSFVGNNGTGVNTPKSNQSGFLNKSWNFVNTSVQYIKVTDTDSIIKSTWTSCLWVKYQPVTSTYDPSIIGKYNGNGVDLRSWWIGIQNNGGYMQVGISVSGTSATNYLLNSPSSVYSTLTGGTGWCFVVGMYDGTYLRMFLNNVEITSSNIGSKTCYQSTQDIWIGMGYGVLNSTCWKGNIDQTLVYNRALTSGEMTELYNNGYR